MAYFASLWKARTVEKYRLKSEKEKINSIIMADIQIPNETFFQKWRHCKYDTRKRIFRRFREWNPEGSAISNFLIQLNTKYTFPNILWKSLLGFFGGIFLTYVCFMFLIFQLSLTWMHATILSSIIGVLLSLGLAFSNRVRFVHFLPFSKVRHTVKRFTQWKLVIIASGLLKPFTYQSNKLGLPPGQLFYASFL